MELLLWLCAHGIHLKLDYYPSVMVNGIVRWAHFECRCGEKSEEADTSFN